MSELSGQGLHSAARSAVKFRRREGNVALRVAGVETAIHELKVADTLRSSAVALRDGVRVSTVEHLFAALAGLGLYAGVVVEIDGPEVPLLDGGASRFVERLSMLGAPRSSPPLRVARDGMVSVGDSQYEFSVLEGAVIVEVEVEFDHPRIARHARWEGDPDDFASRIAPARTFGFEHEVEALLARGLASHVSPESVVVLGPDRILCAGAPYTSDEPVRHKLLDVMGDAYVHGGPPRGRLHAFKPGHAATHEAMKRAIDLGILRHH